MNALIISNRPAGWPERATLIRALMPFVERIVVVAPRAVAEACATLDLPGLEFHDEAGFIDVKRPEAHGLAAYEHATFNFILRAGIITSPRAAALLGSPFLLLDDDNVPLFPISREHYIREGRRQAYYFGRLDRLPPPSLCFRSYDVSLHETRAMLEARGMGPGLIFSSHMPQVIDQEIFTAACRHFDLRGHGYMICDWSMYFNYALHRHPERFTARPAPVICWPMNRLLAAGACLAPQRLFENHYAANYGPGGIFDGLEPLSADPGQNREKVRRCTERFRPRPVLALGARLLYATAPLVPSRLVRLAHAAWKTGESGPRRIKHTLLLAAGMRGRSYIPAMRSRRWPRPGYPTVVGLFGRATGLGESARQLCRTMEDAGMPARRVDASPWFRTRDLVLGRLPRLEDRARGPLVFMLGPPQAQRVLLGQDLDAVQQRLLVNYLWYESNAVPAAWERAMSSFDEIWVYGPHVHSLLEPVCARIGVPLRMRPFVPRFPAPARVRGVYAPDKVSILFIFNTASGIHRKNPLALVRAWDLLPARARKRAELIIKIDPRPGSRIARRHARLLRRLAREHGFRLLEREFDEAEIVGLVQGCSIYASLHRLEGLGLVPLQAMALGRAVLATGWSGVMDYLDEDCAALVDYEVRQAAPGLPAPRADMVAADRLVFAAGARYAEPDPRHAAALLERLILDPDERTRLARAGQERFRHRCQEIRAMWASLAREWGENPP